MKKNPCPDGAYIQVEGQSFLADGLWGKIQQRRGITKCVFMCIYMVERGGRGGKAKGWGGQEKV